MGKKTFKKKANLFMGESNPFNVKINREKHCILGQKLRGTKGLPVASRGESHAKRKELYNKAKVKFHKANHFVDKRLMDGSESNELAAATRLITERKKKLKKNKFNLNDEEELTHLGQSLQDIKSFEDKGSASEDEEPLSADFVKEAHFGGFKNDHKEQPKSHKEIMEQLIVDSKHKKFEKKAERELTLDLTQKLDKDWKDMLSVMSGIKTGQPTDVKASTDPFDIITKELMFEKKAAPAKKVKSKEEMEKEEQERLKKSEEERRLRMNDASEVKSRKGSNHISADSLCDEFDYQPIDINATASSRESAPESESEYSDSDESVDSEASENLDDSHMSTNDSNIEVAEQEEPMHVEVNMSGIPETLEEFEDLISSCNDSNEISKVIEGVYIEKLQTKSKKLLSRFDSFFGILLEYALKSLNTKMEITEIIPSHLHALAEVSPLNTALKLLPYLDQEQKKLQEQTKKNSYPELRTLMILKYCTVLYSVSDFRHPVITPAMIVMSDILSMDCFMTYHNIASRLFVCKNVLDCTFLSKRFCPEAIYFLHKVLKLAVQNDSSPKQKKKEINLVLSDKSALDKIKEISLLDLKHKTCDNAMKLGLISQTIGLLQLFSDLYVDFPSYLEFFDPVLSTCKALPTDFYPTHLRDLIQNLKKSLDSKLTPLCYLVYQDTKPKPLTQFEPAFESKYTSSKDDVNRKFKMIKKVSQKIRKEEKGLLREMRRDVQMIAAEKLKETLESDAERKRKVKELYHDLAVQEGEYKNMMRKKSKM